MRILITGNSGFIGQHLSIHLIVRGYKVIGLGNKNGGVLNKKLVERKMSGVDAVVHLAALTSHKDIVGKMFGALETNFIGTKNVLDAFVKSKTAKKFIYVSTGKVYGKIARLPIDEAHPTNPLNILGKSKLITERLIDFYTSSSLSTSEKEFVIFRAFQIYGSGQKGSFLIPTIVSQINSGIQAITLGDVKATRDYVHIDDLIEAIIKVIEKKAAKGLFIYNICTGIGSSAREIVQLIEKIKGIKIKIKINKKLLRNDEMREEYGSYKNVKKELDWEPKITLEVGLRKIMNIDTKALVLAGGIGTRMQKLFPKTPKILIPVNRKPFINYLISYLSGNISSIILSTGYLGDNIKKYIDQSKFDVPIEISHENKPLGTGGPIGFTLHNFTDDFFLVFGDVYSEVNLKKLLAFQKKRKALITAVIHESLHPEDSNLVEFDSNRKITKILIKPHGKSGKNLFNLAALYVLSPKIGKYLPKKANYDFEKDILFKLVDENLPIYAYNTTEKIMDFGTPERLKKLEKLLK